MGDVCYCGNPAALYTTPVSGMEMRACNTKSCGFMKFYPEEEKSVEKKEESE